MSGADCGLSMVSVATKSSRPAVSTCLLSWMVTWEHTPCCAAVEASW